jgi:hypothetical protein
MGGAPVYRGTRVPVDMVAAMLAQGASTQEILQGYPSLNQEQVELAPLYVAAFPRRGRPARRPWAKQKPILGLASFKDRELVKLSVERDYIFVTNNRSHSLITYAQGVTSS